MIVTTDGRVITGIVQQQDDDAADACRPPTKLVVLPRGEIDRSQLSQQSMMPDDLLKPLSDARSPLAGRLSGQSRASADAGHGRQREELLQRPRSDRLARRSRRCGASRTARSSAAPQGLKDNEFLRSDLAFGDFRLRVEVQLVDNAGQQRHPISQRSPWPTAWCKGYQADIGAGWWGKLYEEHGRGLLWTKIGRSAIVKPGDGTLRDRRPSAARSAPGSTASRASTWKTPAAPTAASSPCNSTPAERPKSASRIFRSSWSRRWRNEHNARRRGVSDTKTHFSELLDKVAAGEEITITRHGTPVARLVPIKKQYSVEERQAAIERFEKLSKGLSLGGLRFAT